MNQNDLMSTLSEAAQKHVDPNSPMPMRMMAAKAMVPLAPQEMLEALCGLSLDEDDKIATTAQTTLSKLPDKILGPALEAKLPKGVFEVIAPNLNEREELQSKLVLNRHIPDEVLALIAPDLSADVADMVAGNQERCMRSETLVRAIATNTNILRSNLDRLFDFLVRAGVIYDGMNEFNDAMGRLSPNEMQEAADKIELPPSVSEWVETETVESTTPTPSSATQTQKSDDEHREKKISMLKLVNSLSVAQKVSLALKGNKEARSILVRDTNKVVATATIRSPRITEQEVVSAAQSRSISDDVIRIIANSRDMTRSYGVKLALVNNPKTPLPTAMRFLTLLRQNDLKAISKSKGVPSALANQAKRLVLSKSGGR